MNVLLLSSAFNGLTQRAWLELRRTGHTVSVELATSTDDMVEGVGLARPDLIVCPFLKDRVPAQIWERHRTVIIHPGPVGDRGPSSLDWAIMEGETEWGVTALQAVDEMDAGPIWATRTITVPGGPLRKSGLYNGAVADAAIELIHEVVAKAADPEFVPRPLDYSSPDVGGRLRPLMRQADRAFAWSGSTADIVRTIRAADGSPGVRTTLGDQVVHAYDAHPGPDLAGRPGEIVAVAGTSVLVRTGDGTVRIGRLKSAATRNLKLPAVLALELTARANGEPTVLAGVTTAARLDPSLADLGKDVVHTREGDVGIISFDFYNGAMSTAQCREFADVLGHAAAQDTRVLLLRGGESWSNGIHLNVIEAAEHPPAEAWANIQAINEVCRRIVACDSHLVVAAMAGNAGAGGVMMALGADALYVRSDVVLNPHYQTMGLYGSEYWTYTLARRSGPQTAAELTEGCLPISAVEAVELGVADHLLPGGREMFEATVLDECHRLAKDADRYERLLRAKRTRLVRDARVKPLDAHQIEELARMSEDIFDDRRGFDAARRDFVFKTRPRETPPRLAAHRAADTVVK